MAQTTAHLSLVTINEIGHRPSGFLQDHNGDNLGNFSDDYIELINMSGSAVDISGWQFYENRIGVDVKHTFAPGTVLAGNGGKITVVDSGGGTANAITNVTGTAVYSTAELTVSNLEVLVLYDPGSNQYIWIEGSGATLSTKNATLAKLLSDHPGATQAGPVEVFGPGVSGESMQRATDGDDTWVSDAPNPGDANCFLEGTWIATPECERLVQDLEPGDEILTADGRSVAVRFNLRQGVHTRVSLPERLEPVRFLAGSLGAGQPHSDLFVTADHGMILDGLVINASALVNGTSIDFVPHADLPEQFIVYHIETEDHDVILANGAHAETFIDYRDRRSFDNYRQYLDLFGTDRVIEEMDRPRISAQRLVPATIRKRLGIPDEMIDFGADLDWTECRRRA